MCNGKLNEAGKPQKSLGGKKKKKETYHLIGKIKLDLGRIYNELKISSFQCVSNFLKYLLRDHHDTQPQPTGNFTNCCFNEFSIEYVLNLQAWTVLQIMQLFLIVIMFSSSYVPGTKVSLNSLSIRNPYLIPNHEITRFLT